MPENEHDIRLTLLENALDYLDVAVDWLRGEPDQRPLKQGVLNLFAGATLLLKERLRIEDPALLFADSNEFDQVAYQTGNFHGPDLKEVVKRVEALGIAIDDPMKTTLRELAAQRKRLEHFEIAESGEAVVSNASRVLGFALDFIAAEIEPQVDLSGDAVTSLDNLRGALVEFKRFREERLAAIRGELETSRVYAIDCVRCREDACLLDDGPRCLFCGYGDEAEAGAAEYAWIVLDSTEYDITKGGEWAVCRCPECARMSLVDTGSDSGVRYACFGCANTWGDEMDTCPTCGEMYEDRLGVGRCSDCWEALLQRD